MLVYLSFLFWLTFSTFKKNCPAEIRLRASLDGQHLVVKSVNSNHNHDVSKVSVYTILDQAMNVYEISFELEVLFDHLPQQRRLNNAQREEVATMLGLKANKKLVQQHIASKSGHVVVLKDIHNLANHTHTPIEVRILKQQFKNCIRHQVSY